MHSLSKRHGLIYPEKCPLHSAEGLVPPELSKGLIKDTYSCVAAVLLEGCVGVWAPPDCRAENSLPKQTGRRRRRRRRRSSPPVPALTPGRAAPTPVVAHTLGSAVPSRPVQGTPTLAPIWLPHWPAWMCTISRMVPAAVRVEALALGTVRSLHT